MAPWRRRNEAAYVITRVTTCSGARATGLVIIAQLHGPSIDAVADAATSRDVTESQNIRYQLLAECFEVGGDCLVISTRTHEHSFVAVLVDDENGVGVGRRCRGRARLRRRY